MVATRRRNLRALNAPTFDRSGSYHDDYQYGRRWDVESGRMQSPISRFRDAVKTVTELQRAADLKKQLREGIDRSAFEGYRKSDDEIKAIESKPLRKFYQTQNERLDDWVEVDTLVMALADGILDSMNPDPDSDGYIETTGALQGTQESIEPLLPEEEQEKRRKARRNATWAININVIANILLLGAKIIAAVKSDSLSLIASLVDSALDLLCTLIVWTTSKIVAWKLHGLKARFPVGRRRLEPIGILVFSIIMIVSFIQVLQESVQKLLHNTSHEAIMLPNVAIGAMAGTIGLKGLIWFGCIPIKTTQVQALAQDCKTDVIFNTLSLLFPVIGYHANVWWLDPVGAALLSLFIIFDWAHTCLENVSRLTGVAADDRLTRKLLFLAWRFHPLLDAYKSVKAYHAGDGVWVEMDVMMDEKTPLSKAHDVAETLQYCCEGLGEVDRAFVTMDYTSQGPTGHVTDN